MDADSLPLPSALPVITSPATPPTATTATAVTDDNQPQVWAEEAIATCVKRWLSPQTQYNALAVITRLDTPHERLIALSAAIVNFSHQAKEEPLQLLSTRLMRVYWKSHPRSVVTGALFDITLLQHLTQYLHAAKRSSLTTNSTNNTNTSLAQQQILAARRVAISWRKAYKDVSANIDGYFLNSDVIQRLFSFLFDAFALPPHTKNPAVMEDPHCPPSFSESIKEVAYLMLGDVYPYMIWRTTAILFVTGRLSTAFVDGLSEYKSSLGVRYATFMAVVIALEQSNNNDRAPAVSPQLLPAMLEVIVALGNSANRTGNYRRLKHALTALGTVPMDFLANSLGRYVEVMLAFVNSPTFPDELRAQVIENMTELTGDAPRLVRKSPHFLVHFIGAGIRLYAETTIDTDVLKNDMDLVSANKRAEEQPAPVLATDSSSVLLGQNEELYKEFANSGEGGGTTERRDAKRKRSLNASQDAINRTAKKKARNEQQIIEPTKSSKKDMISTEQDEEEEEEEEGEREENEMLLTNDNEASDDANDDDSENDNDEDGGHEDEEDDENNGEEEGEGEGEGDQTEDEKEQQSSVEDDDVSPAANAERALSDLAINLAWFTCTASASTTHGFKSNIALPFLSTGNKNRWFYPSYLHVLHTAIFRLQ
eukprot:TRINITY_DN1245_c1_g1_i2.p2 TRINITY_DN1245_c1_g1~~TRINITY_DN1245_c1_g1_i2.p2  ORF type:complete len:653 (+),score=150.57 TRINITY_DN1245_c1_g1_i2:97-2055(+)